MVPSGAHKITQHAYIFFHRVQVDLKIVVPNTYECEAISEGLLLKNILYIKPNYKSWYTHLTQGL